jgi:hypothetical protein
VGYTDREMEEEKGRGEKKEKVSNINIRRREGGNCTKCIIPHLLHINTRTYLRTQVNGV